MSTRNTSRLRRRIHDLVEDDHEAVKDNRGRVIISILAAHGIKNVTSQDQDWANNVILTMIEEGELLCINGNVRADGRSNIRELGKGPRFNQFRGLTTERKLRQFVPAPPAAENGNGHSNRSAKPPTENEEAPSLTVNTEPVQYIRPQPKPGTDKFQVWSRTVSYLHYQQGGVIARHDGRITSYIALAIGLDDSPKTINDLSNQLANMEAHGILVRHVNGRRTKEIVLVDPKHYLLPPPTPAPDLPVPQTAEPEAVAPASPAVDTIDLTDPPIDPEPVSELPIDPVSTGLEMLMAAADAINRDADQRAEIAKLREELESREASRVELQTLRARDADANRRVAALQGKYDELAKAHNALRDSYDALLEHNRQLEEANQALMDKVPQRPDLEVRDNYARALRHLREQRPHIPAGTA